MSCTRPGFDQGLMILFTNTAEDSELRVGAYLALMSCPSQETVNQVKMVLTDEPVNQVGSFVWTHLTNIQETQMINYDIPHFLEYLLLFILSARPQMNAKNCLKFKR